MGVEARPEAMETDLKQAEEVLTELIREGRLVEAAELIFRRLFRPLLQLVMDNARAIRELREALEAERDLRQRLEGRVGRIEGYVAERRAYDTISTWFKRNAPEYDVMPWFATGADVLISGRGVLASVEIAVIPKEEDVRQLKNGVGAIKNEWGRTPDVLIIYSQSGVVPTEVADLAVRLGVRVVRGPRELKSILDEIAGAPDSPAAGH